MTLHMTLPAGFSVLQDHRLQHTRVLEVEVEGLGYDIVYNLLDLQEGQRRVRHVPSAGELHFAKNEGLIDLSTMGGLFNQVGTTKVFFPPDPSPVDPAKEVFIIIKTS